MSSTYAPLPFSYLAPSSQAPKTTGFRRDDGLYGSRTDMAKPIPALRHDLPRRPGDWSIDNRLRGGELTGGEGRQARGLGNLDGDSESVMSYGNVRLPRPDVSLYQSQIDGPNARGRFGPADTPSGHYGNRSPVDDVDAELPSSHATHAGGGMFDNFILKGPGAQSSGPDTGKPNTAPHDADDDARRLADERPPQRSRLERLFDDDGPSSVEVTHARMGLDTDVADSRLPRISEDREGTDRFVERPGTSESIHTTTDSSAVTNSRPNSYGNGHAKLMQTSSASDAERSSRCCCCCGGDHSAVYCSRCRLCIIVFVAFFIALMMFGVGFVAGWFASQQFPASAGETNVTSSTLPWQNATAPALTGAHRASPSTIAAPTTWGKTSASSTTSTSRSISTSSPVAAATAASTAVNHVTTFASTSTTARVITSINPVNVTIAANNSTST